MHIGFYAPFKPLGHPHPSGDQIIAKGLVQSFESHGNSVTITSNLRCRWIYRSPRLLLRAFKEFRRLSSSLADQKLDCWFTYHSYYKSPDILGPILSRKVECPYIIQQGSYATKFSRQWKTLPGFLLNRYALKKADTLITDRQRDYLNLKRLVSQDKIHMVKPGISTSEFQFHQESRNQLRSQWQIPSGTPIICTAAMFRADVKSLGIEWIIDCCQQLVKQQVDFHLLIIGDGVERNRLHTYAQQLPAGRYRFVGRVPHQEMFRYFSAADLFAFPGFNESLGMVFLEAQCCGLPVVACENGGIPEIMQHQRTGFLIPLQDKNSFSEHIRLLLENAGLRKQMGFKATSYVQNRHDRNRNNLQVIQIIQRTVAEYRKKHA